MCGAAGADSEVAGDFYVLGGLDFDNVAIDLDGFAVNAGVVWRW